MTYVPPVGGRPSQQSWRTGASALLPLAGALRDAGGLRALGAAATPTGGGSLGAPPVLAYQEARAMEII